jgi:sphinganine-1-phosphate aldolase
VFDQFSHANVLQRDMYPSATKFEGEIIAMTADLLHGTGVGVVTSGGTESLITALYSYRELARARRAASRSRTSSCP